MEEKIITEDLDGIEEIKIEDTEFKDEDGRGEI